MSALAQEHPDVSFVWIDIEDYPDLIGDEDIENFPTILIEQNGVARFAGTILPHIEHLERLIAAMRDSSSQQNTELPDVRDLLIRLADTD